MYTHHLCYLTFWEKASISSSLLPDPIEFLNFKFIVHAVNFEIKYCKNFKMSSRCGSNRCSGLNITRLHKSANI